MTPPRPPVNAPLRAKATPLIQRMLQQVAKDATRASEEETLDGIREPAMMLYRMADLLTDVVSCPEAHLILVGDDLHCCPRGRPYPALLVRPDPEDYWVDVRQIRMLLLAGHHLISLEAEGALRTEVWRSDDPDGDGSITDALNQLEGLPPAIGTTPHGNLLLRGDDLELTYPACWECCTRPPIQPMVQ